MSEVLDNKFESFSSPIFDSKIRLAQIVSRNHSRPHSASSKSALFSSPQHYQSTTLVSPFLYKSQIKYKSRKPSAIDNRVVVRRTVSLDTIYPKRGEVNDVNPNVQWSFDFYSRFQNKTLDKATQTDECLIAAAPYVSHLTWPNQQSNLVQRFSCLIDNVNTATCCPIDPDNSVQSPIDSIEALDEEIEKLVSKQNNMDGEVAKLTRTVKTQTPSTLLSDECGMSSDSGKKTGLSPQINHFAARGPPDGCEKVFLKFSDETPPVIDQLRPNVIFDLKPSSCSAFCSLQNLH